MTLSKIYRGYVIEQDSNNQWFIHNFPEWTTSGAIGPGPFPSWTTAKHQVDKLHEFMNRSESPQSNYQSREEENYYYEDFDNSDYSYNNSSGDSGDYSAAVQIAYIIFIILMLIFIFH